MFVQEIFAASFEQFQDGHYVRRVCDLLQNNNKTVRIGPKDHFKSTSLYAFIMWQIWKAKKDGGFGCFYFSYDRSLSFYHLNKLKTLIKMNPFFDEIVDYKTTAEGLLKYGWKPGEYCTVKPKGMLCLRGDQKILTSNGEKPIWKVNIGEFVLSKDGKQHEILNKFRKYSYDNLLQIKVRNLLDPLIASKEHKLFAIKNPGCFQKRKGVEFCFPYCSRKEKHCSFKEFPKPEWFEAQQLNKGDILVYPKIKEKSVSKYSKDVLRLFGYYLAEGCLNRVIDKLGRKRGGRIRWTIHSKEIDIKEDIQMIVKKYFNGSVYSWPKSENCLELGTINIKLCRILFEEFGKGAKSKRIPFWIETLEFDDFIEFLKGYWLGDGYKNAPCFSLCSANKNILMSIQRSLFNFDIASYLIQFDSCKEKGFVAFRLESFSQKLCDALGKKINKPKTNVQRIWFDKDFAYLPIIKIQQIKQDGVIFDLTIKDEHNYIANSILVSNSFKRGIHEKIILVDDPFQDPANLIDPVIVKKINDIFRTQIIDMPFQDGYLNVVTTPQTMEDFTYDKALMNRFKVLIQPCFITNSQGEKIALWPEHMSLEELEARRKERGEKVFLKEYYCQPAYSTDAFWNRGKVEAINKHELFNMTSLSSQNIVTAGWDIGKFRHPAHITIFERVDGIWLQRYTEFMDGWDYKDQVDHANDLVNRFNIDYAFFDATGREIEGFREKKILNKIWSPIIFKTESKWRMANNMDKLRTDNCLFLIPDDRQTNQLIVVNNSLKAIETPEGHGEPFQSIGLALLAEFNLNKTPVRKTIIIPREKVSIFGRHAQTR